MFPQTAEIRTACGRLGGEIDEEQYTSLMKGEIERVIRLQEEIGLDVLVHGEPERNDMVQYFAEQMDGYVFPDNAWVSLRLALRASADHLRRRVAPERDDGRLDQARNRSRTSR